MNDAMKALRAKLSDDIEKTEELIALLRAGTLKSFSIDANHKKHDMTGGQISHYERIVENLKEVVARIDEE